MKLFGLLREKHAATRDQEKERPRIQFASTRAMEQALDGSDDSFEQYFFAIYHCSPFESAGIVERRNQLRNENPEKAIPVGKNFVLSGESAWLALAAYYQALVNCDTLSDDFRAHAGEHLAAIEAKHRRSQSLPIPIELTEGQLSHDDRLEFYASLAISNGQIIVRI
jgi:hypothetical protein